MAQPLYESLEGWIHIDINVSSRFLLSFFSFLWWSEFACKLGLAELLCDLIGYFGTSRSYHSSEELMSSPEVRLSVVKERTVAHQFSIDAKACY